MTFIERFSKFERVALHPHPISCSTLTPFTGEEPSLYTQTRRKRSVSAVVGGDEVVRKSDAWQSRASAAVTGSADDAASSLRTRSLARRQRNLEETILFLVTFNASTNYRGVALFKIAWNCYEG